MDVVFDIGNVLLRWDPRFLYRKVFADQARMEDFLATACSSSWILSLDGLADYEEAIVQRAADFPDYADELQLFDTRWLETLGGAIEDNVRIVERLKAQGRPVYALTNYAKCKFDLTRPVYPILDLFDEVVVSGREGVTKPDPRIYRNPVRALGPQAGTASLHRRRAAQYRGCEEARDGGDPLCAGRRCRGRVGCAGNPPSHAVIASVAKRSIYQIRGWIASPSARNDGQCHSRGSGIQFPNLRRSLWIPDRMLRIRRG